MSNKLLFVLILLSFISCRSSKDLILLKDLSDGQKTGTLDVTVTEHLVKPGDVLFVSIKSINPEVNSIFNPEEGMDKQSYGSYQKYTTQQGAYLYGFEVNSAGELALPVLGKIQVAGNPQQKVEELIQQKADVFLKDAIVKVKLLNFKVTILGEVRNPGVFYNYNNTFTVLDALAMANGNTDYANIKNVKLIRPGEKGNTSYQLDLSSKNIYTSEAFYLQPNDYILVQPHKLKNLQLNSQSISIGFSSLSLLLSIFVLLLR